MKVESLNLPKPKHVPRTGETELHLMGNLLARHTDKLFYATEKLDGFSFSIGEGTACTRDHLVNPFDDSVFAEFLRTLENRMDLDALPALFQGELVGPGIRGNRYGLDSVRFYVFDVLKNGKRIDYAEAASIAESCGFEWVPVIGTTAFYATAGLCNSLCYGFSDLAKIPREGIVCRTMTETFDEYQGRVSFKVFNPDYPFHH